MQRLTLAEIRQRAIKFGHDWKDERSERAEAQTFWNEFFEVFGIKRRSVASFERTVKNLGGAYDRIDVIWSGKFIGEHKSRGEDLSKAASQAFGYVQSLTAAGRDSEIPQYILVSDFATIVVHDLEATDPLFQSFTIPVEQLYQHIRLFDFISGFQSRPIDPEDPINIDAVEVLGKLHDALETGGYSGHRLERFLVRVLFCLFAEDTTIFDPDAFKSLVEETREDGSDLGPQLDRFFKVLDTIEDQRGSRLPEQLKSLPYVNGDLFTERLDLADFDGGMRDALLEACKFQWSKISPAVFGSLFQSIMAGEAGARRRRQIGAHYTSERDIMKLVRSLFLDDLRAEFEKIKSKRNALLEFHEKLAKLKFLDPACGCGNFLVITYRELRKLEHEVIDALFPDHGLIDIVSMVKLNVDQMHGIEIEEWPARIAEVAMWLIDHQMNLEASQKFGKGLLRLPLKKSAKIVHGNALRIDWNEVLPASECSYVMGNPPFIGKKEQTADQKADHDLIWGKRPGTGILDYVTCWYFKTCEYSQNSATRIAFVSTNSISQGEQVAPLWQSLLREFSASIFFAHRPFAWQSEARGRAHVHVVIIGFSRNERPAKSLFEYVTPTADPIEVPVIHINHYLTAALDVFVENRKTPISGSARMNYGSMMIDKDRKADDEEGLLLSRNQRDSILSDTPELAPYIRQVYGGDEFLNGTERWCLWLVDAPRQLIRANRSVEKRIAGVRKFRSASKRPQTRELSSVPHLFGEIRQPSSKYLLFPKVGAQTRRYFPIGFVDPQIIATGSALIVPDATRHDFGILSSAMHASWLYYVGGRMKSDPQYSASIVYNNYPWPTEATDAQKQAVEKAAQGVLDARAAFAGQTLADLYDPLAMPKLLRDAHRTLDRAVDRCYRPQPFDSDRHRVEYLFQLYEKLTTLFVTPKKKRRVSR